MLLASRYFIGFFFCYLTVASSSVGVQATDGGNSVEILTRIQNGFNAHDGEIPYVVSLQNVENDKHFCGGSILSSNWVLTAAHCTESNDFDIKAEQIRVATGTINSTPVSVHRVTRIRRHERYAKNDSAINDIALLKVTPPFVYNGFVAPVKLPKSHLYIPPGTKALVAGWGSITHPIRTMPKLLQKLDATIVSENYCKEMYMQVIKSIYSVHLCTHETDGGFARGSCKGDSGGPLTINDTIVGIVSWSRKNESCSTYPTVYTRVSEFVTWIMETMYD